MNKTLNVAGEFSPHPFGLTDADGKFNATRLRKIIANHLRNSDCVTVDLTGSFGLPASFIRVTFGDLVTHEGFTREELATKLVIVNHKDASIPVQARQEIEAATPEKAANRFALV